MMTSEVHNAVGMAQRMLPRHEAPGARHGRAADGAHTEHDDAVQNKHQDGQDTPSVRNDSDSTPPGTTRSPDNLNILFAVNTTAMMLLAQQNLKQARDAIAQAMERLSSGKRVNHAADDAAGQAIANRMTALVDGLKQAQVNANHGISIAQTSEQNLRDINDSLQKIRTLVVKATDDTKSLAELRAIQHEIEQHLAEINRVAQQAKYGDIRLLDGSSTSIDIQVGALDSQSVRIEMARADAEALGVQGLTIDGHDSDTASMVSRARFGNVIYDRHADQTTATMTNHLLFDDGDNRALTGLTLHRTHGMYFVSNDTTAALHPVVGFQADAGKTADDEAVVTIHVDTDSTIKRNTIRPLAHVDVGLDRVNRMSSHLGAAQNRLASAINTMTVTQTSLSAARSRIVDADYAVEVSRLSKARVIEQAGIAVTAQANQTPRSVAALLRR